VRIGQALRCRLRDSDIVARLGGDEFALLLPGGDEAETQSVAEALLEVVRNEALPACDRVRIWADRRGQTGDRQYRHRPLEDGERMTPKR